MPTKCLSISGENGLSRPSCHVIKDDTRNVFTEFPAWRHVSGPLNRYEIAALAKMHWTMHLRKKNAHNCSSKAMTSGINFQAQALSGIFGQYSCLQQQLPFSRLWAKGVSQNDNGGNVAPNLWFRSKLSAPKGTKLTKPGFAFGCLQFNCMAQFCSKTVALLMPGPMVAQEPHLKYVWCTHTICQYGENYAFITNRATTAPKEQCERTKMGHFAILLDRCACWCWILSTWHQSFAGRNNIRKRPHAANAEGSGSEDPQIAT